MCFSWFLKNCAYVCLRLRPRLLDSFTKKWRPSTKKCNPSTFVSWMAGWSHRVARLPGYHPSNHFLSLQSRCPIVLPRKQIWPVIWIRICDAMQVPAPTRSLGKSPADVLAHSVVIFLGVANDRKLPFCHFWRKRNASIRSTWPPCRDQTHTGPWWSKISWRGSGKPERIVLVATVSLDVLAWKHMDSLWSNCEGIVQTQSLLTVQVYAHEYMSVPCLVNVTTAQTRSKHAQI